MAKSEDFILWTGQIELSTYREKPCGDDTWELEQAHWDRASFTVRLCSIARELKSEYLADTMTPNHFDRPVERWESLYGHNHTAVLEAVINAWKHKASVWDSVEQETVKADGAVLHS